MVRASADLLALSYSGSGGNTDEGHDGTDAGPKGPNPPRPGPDCEPGGIAPDFVRFSFSVGYGLGATIEFAVDRYQNTYFSLGGSAGRGVPVSISAAVGYVAKGPRTQQNTIETLSNWSFSTGASVIPLGQPGLYAGMGGSSNFLWGGNNASVEAGLYSPQLGGGPSYTWVSKSNNSCK